MSSGLRTSGRKKRTSSRRLSLAAKRDRLRVLGGPEIYREADPNSALSCGTGRTARVYRRYAIVSESDLASGIRGSEETRGECAELRRLSPFREVRSAAKPPLLLPAIAIAA